MWGDLVRARVHVTNGTLEPIVLRAVDLAGQLPGRRLWLTTRAGRLRYDAPRKRVVWRPRVRDETEEVFASGLLLSGETITVERWLRVRTPVVDVAVLYQPAGLNVFYPTSSKPTPERGEPWEVHFRSSTISGRSAFRRGKPGGEQRVVLFYGAEATPIVRRHIRVALDWSDIDMPGAVLDELDVGSGELSAWDGGPAWIVRRPQGGDLVVVSREGARDVFPGVDFLIFDLADIVSLEGSDLLVDLVGQEAYDRVDPVDFLEFLRGVRNQGSRVDVAVVDTGADSLQYVLRLR